MSAISRENIIVVEAPGQFHGGVYPPENKSQSMQQAPGSLPIPATLIFPVSQHMGAPAEPIVAVGDKVLAGQKIAEAIGAFSASIHASSSGTVTAIEDRPLPHASGMSGLCIVIETDGQHQSIDSSEQAITDYTSKTPAELLSRIRESGITGLGGAGFPTAVKLNPQSHYAIDTLILNGTECEPYITADHSLMLHHAASVINGAKLLSFMLGNPENILIGVEDNKPDAIEALEAAIKEAAQDSNDDVISRIRIMTFPTKYPSGGEKQLIQLLTGKEVPSGAIPAQLGIVMQNVGTAVAAYDAVVNGKPLTSRITTFVGEALNSQRNMEVLLGTPIEFALETMGFNASDNERLIMGGPMMGFALHTATTPIVKSTNCIIAPSRQELPTQPSAQECIRCGMCAEACPVSLLPQQLYWYSKAEDYEKAQNYNLFDCIECGACSFVCPSNIPLVQYYRAAKGSIRQQEKEKVKSDHARQRFEFRKLRIERAEAEKVAKREARKKAAAEAKRLQAEKQNAATGETADANTKASVDPVAAAMAKVQQQKNDPAAQQAKLERTINSSKDRIQKLKDKLADAEGEQQDRISAQIKQAEVRLQDSEQQLAELADKAQTNEVVEKPGPAAKKASSKATAQEKTDSQDAASRAIEKAKAKSAAMATMSEEERLQQQIDSLQTRLSKAKDKLAKAEAENSEHIDAFRTGVEKMQNKLNEKLAEQENSAS